MGKGEEASASLNSEFITTSGISSIAYTVQFPKSKHVKVSRQLFRTPNAFSCCIYVGLHLQWAVVKRFFLGTAWSQDADDPVGLRGARGLGTGAPSWLLETSLQHSPQPHRLLLLSSGVTLNVVFHFIPEVLLVPQMMFCSFNIQRIIKIQKISKQRV